jgi:prepilin-type N-terminal cleavage/methylation domain-containing protein
MECKKISNHSAGPGSGDSGYKMNRRFGNSGFTLLEVLVAILIIGIAISVVLQLFSANLQAIGVSGDYVAAVTRAESKMREILDDQNLSEKAFTETTDDGFRIDVAVIDALRERTEDLEVKILQIDLTIHWTKGSKEKSLTLRTMKVAEKKI